ncbi:MAG: alpha-glucosidase [Erysipelotrichaceae bacterium]|nr:alpha-glucosidase [Erysipelotrichaceae bacterium]
MKTRWYKNAIVYQIYPFSFMDCNNDGWGDIEGIISKLDHVKDLGVTAIWFSPLYRSPDYDYGYDVADYLDIDEKFGTMADFDRLLEECHKRDLKVIMDMVINHTSIEHEWFRKAISSPDSEYRDYYIIRKGKRKGKKLLPPTNWSSTFTGSAWERIGDSDEFYLHLFCKEQADLNWENPKVREEIIKILNFWLDKGVDGFRFDVFNMFSKVYPLEDDRSRDFQKGSRYFVDGPRMHEFLKELNEKSFSHYDIFTVGESYNPGKEAAREYVKEDNNELDAIFNFAHLNSDNIAGAKFFKKRFNILEFKDGLFGPQNENYENSWNTLVLENHDNPRSVSRFGLDPKYRYEAATMLATVTFMGFGTPFIYMGEEIGMTNTNFNDIRDMKDPVSHFIYDLLTRYGMPKKLAFSFVKYGARDHARVPMQWNDTVNGGFNIGHRSWQCINRNFKEINVKKDLESERSIYRFYQKLLYIKKNNAAAIEGKTIEYDHSNKKVVAYSRDNKLFILGNFTNKTIKYELPEWTLNGKLILNNCEELVKENQTVTLKPYQAIVIENTEGR